VFSLCLCFANILNNCSIWVKILDNTLESIINYQLIIDQSINRSIDQSINRSINQSINSSINQSSVKRDMNTLNSDIVWSISTCPSPIWWRCAELL
jgi:hypothetical protein